jgi:hypothetical protein
VRSHLVGGGLKSLVKNLDVLAGDELFHGDASQGILRLKYNFFADAKSMKHFVTLGTPSMPLFVKALCLRSYSFGGISLLFTQAKIAT